MNKTTKGAAKGRVVAIDWTGVATIGIDVGDRFSSYCAIDASGGIVVEGRITTTVGAIELELGRMSRKTVAIRGGHALTVDEPPAEQTGT